MKEKDTLRSLLGAVAIAAVALSFTLPASAGGLGGTGGVNGTSLDGIVATLGSAESLPAHWTNGTSLDGLARMLSPAENLPAAWSNGLSLDGIVGTLRPVSPPLHLTGGGSSGGTNGARLDGIDVPAQPKFWVDPPNPD